MKVWIDGMIVKVALKYDENDINDLKAIGGGQWDTQLRLWMFPLEKYDALVIMRDKLNQEIALTPSSDIGREINELVNHLKLGGYSPNTIRAYKGHLERYLRFTGGKRDIESIQNYLLELIDVQKRSHSYCNQSINAIKMHLKLEGVSSNGLLLRIPRPKKQKKLPKVMSKQEVKKLFDHTKNIKHKTAFMMAYSCGMRVSEVANIQVRDIDSDRMVIYIKQGKGRKDRIAPLSESMLVQLRQYYDLYKPKEWLFESQIGSSAIHVRTLQKVYQQQVSALGFHRHVSFHSLRHSFATHLLDSGVDIRYIQELLGHASSKTTEIYTHVTTQSLQKIINPLDQL